MNTLNNEFIVAIIDNLEDWLDAKGVRIPNKEREDEENSANIYGEDFDWIMNMIRDVCKDYGVVVEDKWEH